MTDVSKRHEDRQVKQADTALRFYGYFLPREMKATADAMRAAAGDWKMLEEKVR